MAEKLEGRVKEILDEPYYAVFSVPRADGTVQSVVIWVHTEDGKIAVNSAEGRGWPQNLRRAGTATITVMAKPYEWLTIIGRLVEDVPDADEGHIDALSKKYLNVDRYPGHVLNQDRVKFLLEPERIKYVNQAPPAGANNKSFDAAP